MKKIFKLTLGLFLVASLFDFTIFNNNEISAVSSKETVEKEPSSLVSNGAVKISIPSYNENVGWQKGEIYDVDVTVDFGLDKTSTGKELSITIPDGMRFESIPVVAGKHNTENVDSGKTGILSNTDTAVSWTSLTSSIEVPQMERVTGSTFGTVKYIFDPGFEKQVFNFKVSVDGMKFSEPYTLANPIAVSASKLGGQVGYAEQSISAVGEKYTPQYIEMSIPPAAELLPSTETEKSFGKTRSLHLATDNRFGPERVAIKDPTFYVHYPEGMTYEGIVWEGEQPSSTVHEPENSRVVVKFDGWYRKIISNGIYTYSWINYSVPVGTTPGTFTNKANDYVEFEYFTGTKATVTAANNHKSTVTIVDPNSIVNKMDITSLTWSGGYIDSSVRSEQPAPIFRVLNSTAGKKTNQTAHFEIGAGYNVKGIYLPYDKSSTTSISSVKYKTTLNSSWTSLSQDKLDLLTSKCNANSNCDFNAGLAELRANEYFTEVKANVGNFRENYATVNGRYSTQGIYPYGNLDGNTELTTVKFSMYDSSNISETTAEMRLNVQDGDALASKTTQLDAKANFIETPSGTNQITAGDSFKISSRVNMDIYQYGVTYAMKAPEIYIREAAGLNININSLVLTNSRGETVTGWTYTTHTNAKGEKIYKIKTSESTVLGADVSFKNLNWIDINIDVTTDVTADAVYNARDLIGYGAKGYTLAAALGSSTPGYVDIHDFDGDGNTSEKLFSPASNILIIAKNNNVLVQTFLTVEGEEPKGAYVEGDVSTLAYFTPGTNADYTFKITNNSASPASSFNAYVPIPKTGENFGNEFQTEAFKWDMKLTSLVAEQAGFNVTYASDATASNYKSSATYVENPTDLTTVNMIKIEATEAVATGTRVEFKVGLNVDETFDSANAGNKIGTRNVYAPSYVVDSETFRGTLKGTKAGAELVIAEIGGLVFNDIDGDGLYNIANGDTVVSGHEVELYKLNTTTNAYEPVLDGNGDQYKVKTGANGVYLFDHNTGMNYGNYAVRFVEMSGGAYEYTPNVNTVGSASINSDAIVANDIPNAGDTYRGWVLNIDPTAPSAKTIGAGFLSYNPPIDLVLTMPTAVDTVKVGSSKLMSAESIAPNFWETIKSSTEAYRWELVNPADSAYVTLSNVDREEVRVTGVSKTAVGKTVELKLTIKDIYGNTKTGTMKVIITTNVPPTVTANDIVAYVGDPIANIAVNAGVSATDDYGDAITLVYAEGTSKNAEIICSVPNNGTNFTQAGTYTITHNVTDQYGNTGTVEKLIKISDAPIVSASTSAFTLGTAESTILSDITDNVSATWEKAGDVVGAATTTTIPGPATTVGGNNSIQYTLDESNPSTDFSVVGLYKVNYTATNTDGVVGTLTKEILIANVIDTISLAASGFTIENGEAASLTEALALDADHANAFAMVTATGTPVTNISVNAAELAAINAADELGGIYNLTVTATDGAESISTVIKVVVKGLSTVTDGTLAITASGFVIENSEAASLTGALAIDANHANVNAIIVITGQAVTNISVNAAELTVINAAPTSGGIYNLTITATEGTNTVSTVVTVTVKGTGIVVENGISLYAESFTIENAEAASLDDAKVIEKGNVKAVKTFDSQVVNNITSDSDQLNTIKASTVKGGFYDLKVTAAEGTDTASKDIKVTVKGTGMIIENGISLYAESFTIANGDAAGLDLDGIIANGNVEAYLTGSDVRVEDISIDEAQLAEINNAPSFGGIYMLNITATNGADSVTKSIYVIVEGTNVTGGDIAISANGFSLTIAEAQELDEDTAKELSEIFAIDSITGQELDNITVNPDHLAAINNVSPAGGRFELEFIVTNEDGTTETMSVYVTVAGQNVVVENGIAIEAFGFTSPYEESINLTADDVKLKSNARAWYVLDGTSINNLGVNVEHLDTIKKGPKSGGFYEVEINVVLSSTRTSTQPVTSIKIPVVVLSDNVVSKSGVIAIAGYDATIHKDDAKDLDVESTIELLNAYAVVVSNGERLDVAVDSSQLAYIKRKAAAGETGTYPITISSTYTDSNGDTYEETLELSITVTGNNLSATGLNLQMLQYSIIFTIILGLILIVIRKRKEIV